jgi:hypothetical protein
VRQAQLARELGVSRQSINELVARGVLTTDSDGLLDVSSAKKALANRVHPTAKTAQAIGVPLPPDPQASATEQEDVTSYHVAKTLRELAEARIAQLKLATMQGDLVPIEDIRRQWATEASRQREAWLQFADRLAPLLEMRPLAFVRQTIDAEVRQILNGLAA